MSNKCGCGEFEYQLPPGNPDSPVMIYGEQKLEPIDGQRERWRVKVEVCPDYDPVVVRQKLTQYMLEHGAASDAVVDFEASGMFPTWKA